MISTSTQNSQLSFTPTLPSSITSTPAIANTPSFRSPDVDEFNQMKLNNQDNKKISHFMEDEEEESQTQEKSTINASPFPISSSINASREANDFQQSKVQQSLQFQQQDTCSTMQHETYPQVGAIRREQLLASLASLDMKIQLMNDIKNEQGDNGRRLTNNFLQAQHTNTTRQQLQQTVANNNVNSNPFNHKDYQEKLLQQKQNNTSLDHQNQQLRASLELRQSQEQHAREEQSNNEESDQFLETAIKEEYLPQEQKQQCRTHETTNQNRTANNELLNQIKQIELVQQQQQFQLKLQHQQHGCSPLLLLSPRKIFKQQQHETQIQQYQSPSKQFFPGVKIEADSSKLFQEDRLHSFFNRCSGLLNNDYPNNNKSGFAQAHRQTLQQQSCFNDNGGTNSSSQSSSSSSQQNFSEIKLKKEQSQDKYFQNLASSCSKSSVKEESCISEEEDEDGMAMRHQYSALSESKAKEFGLIKELINRIVNTLDRDEALSSEQSPRQYIIENEQLTEKKKEEYLLICTSLIKKFRQLKKTKEEKTKFIMRKAFRYLFSQLKTCCSGKMNLKEANEICMKHYFSQHVHDSQFVLPFRRNSSIKTMNAAFLKKVFASSTFSRDYRNFLKYFDVLAMQDNQKKVEQLSYYILPMIEENKFDKIESLRRLPWTMHLLNSTKSLAHQLLEFEDTQQSAMLHYSLPQFTQQSSGLPCQQTLQRIQSQRPSTSILQYPQYFNNNSTLDALPLHSPTLKIQQLSSSEKTISLDGDPRKRSLSDSLQSFQFQNTHFLTSTSTSSSSASSSETDSKISNEEISSYLDQINGVLANMADVQQNNQQQSSWQTCSAVRSLKRKIIIITPPNGFFDSMKKNLCESKSNDNNNQGNCNNLPNASK